MHDIDRVRLETEYEDEAGEYEAGEYEFESSGEVFGETETMELASELLEVSSQGELEQFLGDLVAKAGQSLGQFVGSPQGKALVGALKGAARQVLPTLGSSVGGYFGGDTGAKLGAQAAGAAGRALGLELEGLSGEDREFEVAKHFVNFAGEAVKNLADAPGGDPRGAAKAAVMAAAQTHAPGLLRVGSASAPSPGRRNGTVAESGRWVRHGSKIILFGV